MKTLRATGVDDVLTRVFAASHRRQAWVSDARERWLREHGADGARTHLHDLESVAGGLVAWSDARNRPRCLERAATTDTLLCLRVFATGLEHVRMLCHTLVGPNSSPHGVLDVTARARDAIVSLQHAANDLHVIAIDLLHGGIVSQPTLDALCAIWQNAIADSTFFAAADTFSFFRDGEPLEDDAMRAIAAGVSNTARDVHARLFLILRRSAAQLARVGEPETAEQAWLALLVLAGIRSDLRKLVRYAMKDALSEISDAFEGLLLGEPAHTMSEHSSELAELGERLMEQRSHWAAHATRLRMEFLVVFETVLPRPESVHSNESFTELSRGIAAMREVITKESAAFASLLSDGKTSVRQNEVWMLMQVVRAFVAMAAGTEAHSSTWHDADNTKFVQDYVRHFRLLGYSVLRALQYPRSVEFLEALLLVQEADLIDPSRLRLMEQESQTLLHFLQTHLAAGEHALTQAELERAKDMLRIYLAAA